MGDKELPSAPLITTYSTPTWMIPWVILIQAANRYGYSSIVKELDCGTSNNYPRGDKYTCKLW